VRWIVGISIEIKFRIKNTSAIKENYFNRLSKIMQKEVSPLLLSAFYLLLV
jgi:hypothetical protein